MNGYSKLQREHPLIPDNFQSTMSIFTDQLTGLTTQIDAQQIFTTTTYLTALQIGYNLNYRKIYGIFCNGTLVNKLYCLILQFLIMKWSYQ